MSLTIFTILIMVGSFQICASTITRFTRINPTTCVCPGDTLTYECVTTGPIATVWTGTSFVGCASEGNQILLSHGSFITELSASKTRECNDGSVSAQGIDITDGQCYRSLLNVTVDPLFNNSDVMCAHHAADGTQKEIGNSTIHISGPPEPAVVYLMDANSTHLTFAVQSPVIPNCSHIRYSVEASSNCGSCPESTNSTTIICSNFTTSVDTNNTCNLTVGGIICDNIPGEKASLLIILKVPNAPFIKSQPIYLQERPGILAELTTSFNITDTFNISDAVNGSAINYTIIYSNSTSGKSCSSITIPASSCVNGICSHLFDVLSSSDCPASANITTTVFGTNVFGNGPLSNPTTSDGINKLVRVSFDSATNRLRCIFSSLPNDVLKQCTASITYGINCDQQFSDLYSNESTGEFVTIPPLELMSDVTEYCFIVTASSNNLTATVRGIFFAIDTTKMNATSDKGTDSEEARSMIIVIILPVLAVLFLIAISVAISLYLYVINHLRIHEYTIEIEIKNDIASVIKALEVFEELKINIRGFNTYLRHKDFKRQDPDLPGQTLEEDLRKELIPERGTIPNLAKKFAVKDTNYGIGENKIIVEIKFPVKDEVGCLCRALRTLQRDEGIKVVGINTGSVWESDEYHYHHVKFSCSRMQKKRINNKLNEKKISVKRVIGQARVDERSTQAIELYVPNTPGNLASALCAFDTYELNITSINELQPRPAGAEDGYRNILVKCSCTNDNQARLKTKLEKHDARNVEITSMGDNCTVTYSVGDMQGSLYKSLKGFKECEVNIIAITSSTDGAQNIEYQKNYIVFESTNEEKVQLIEHIQSINRAFVVKRSSMPLSMHNLRTDAAASTETD